MAGVYTSALDAMMSGDLDLTGGTATAYLVTAAYSPNLATHASVADVPAETRQEDATVTGRAVSGGVWTATPTTFPGAEGSPVSAIVIAVEDQLVAYVDDFGSGPGQTELSLNGSDITATWPSTGIVAFG